MNTLTAESLVRFVKDNLTGRELKTKANEKPFTVEVLRDSIEVTVGDTGNTRPIGPGEIEKFCEQYSRTKSTIRKDYTDTQNGSYLIALVGYMEREQPT